MPGKADNKPIQIKHGYPPFKRRIQHTPEILHAMDRVCTAWAKSLGTYATFTIDNRRFAILSELLIAQGRTADELGWAILAYAEYVQSSDWHRQQGGVHKTFESFLTDPRLEDWLAKGDEFRDRRQATARKATETRRQTRRISEYEALYLKHFERLTRFKQEEVLETIVREYEIRTRADGRTPIGIKRPVSIVSLCAPLIRSLLHQWLQAQEAEDAKRVQKLGSAVDEVLTG